MIDRFGGGNLHPALARFGRCAGIVAPPFVFGIGVLALSLLGVVDLGPRVVERDFLIFNLLLYWVIAAVVLAAILDIRAVCAYVGKRIVPIVVASASLLLSLAAAEYAAHVFIERTEGFQLLFSAELHHKNPANAALRDNTGASVHTNEDGLRTSWTRGTFQETAQRIVVLGDSFVFGLGVDDDKTAPYVLERVLRDRLRTDDLGVLNAGVISYSPLIERSAFRGIVRDYRPTHTILVLDLGDIGDDYAYAADVVPGSDPRAPRFVRGAWTSGSRLSLARLAEPILAPLYVPGEVFRRVTNQPRRRRSYRDFEIMIGDVVEKDRWFILRHPLEETRRYFETSLAYIEDIANDARASGSEFMLVVAPRYFQWSDRECPNDWAKVQLSEFGEHRFANFQFFDQARKRESFPIVSLLPAFQATGRFPLVFDHDAHWNDAGNEFVADILAGVLLELGWLRGGKG